MEEPRDVPFPRAHQANLPVLSSLHYAERQAKTCKYQFSKVWYDLTRNQTPGLLLRKRTLQPFGRIVEKQTNISYLRKNTLNNSFRSRSLFE